MTFFPGTDIDPEQFIFGSFISFCTLLMLIMLFHLAFKLCGTSKSDEKQSANSIHIGLRMTSIICIISSILSSACDAVNVIQIKAGHTRELTIYYAISGTLFYISSMSLYIRMIYFGLNITYSDTIYAYSIKQQLCVSIPIFVSLPCEIWYIYQILSCLSCDSSQDHIIHPLIIVIMIMDLILNITTLCLFIRPLQRLIIDKPVEEYLINNSDPKKSIHSISKSQSSKRSRSNLRQVSIRYSKITFRDNNHVQGLINVISRYTILAIFAVIFNELFFIAFTIFVFGTFEKDHLENTVRRVALSLRAVDNLVNVLVQYLLFHRYTKHVYITLCGKCHRMCVECCRNRLKRRVMEKATKGSVNLLSSN